MSSPSSSSSSSLLPYVALLGLLLLFPSFSFELSICGSSSTCHLIRSPLFFCSVMALRPHLRWCRVFAFRQIVTSHFPPSCRAAVTATTVDCPIAVLHEPSQVKTSLTRSSEATGALRILPTILKEWAMFVAMAILPRRVALVGTSSKRSFDVTAAGLRPSSKPSQTSRAWDPVTACRCSRRVGRCISRRRE